jgi:beta-glucuronidase
MHHIDWFNYGGLYREVMLLRLPAIFIRQASAALTADGAAIRFAVGLSEAVDGEAIVEIAELGLEARVPIISGLGELTVPASPARWSPSSPRLHAVRFAFARDVVTDRIGFRTIETRGTTILLNGEPLWLKGVCVHEDDLELGKVTSELDIRRRFRHARELGCNFLRLAHYPHHEWVAMIADEEGLLLWAEVPVYWAIDFANPATLADGRNQLSELILRDINRASVILWGVGNENADTDARLAFMVNWRGPRKGSIPPASRRRPASSTASVSRSRTGWPSISMSSGSTNISVGMSRISPGLTACSRIPIPASR